MGMKKSFFLFLVIALMLLSVKGALAQTPLAGLLIGWEAKTYVPPAYRGRALPSAESEIVATVDLIDRGRPANLSFYPINWYVNSSPAGGGIGKTTFSFFAPSTLGKGSVRLRAEITSYPGGSITNTIEIPIVSPEAVIVAPHPLSRVPRSFRVEALPYFFNVAKLSELAFSWLVNGEAPANFEDPAALAIETNPDAASGSELVTLLEIRNPRQARESALKAKTFVLGP